MTRIVFTLLLVGALGACALPGATPDRQYLVAYDELSAAMSVSREPLAAAADAEATARSEVAALAR